LPASFQCPSRRTSRATIESIWQFAGRTSAIFLFQTSDTWRDKSPRNGNGTTRLNISPRMRLAEVIKRIEAIPMGGTNCALPMLWAARNKLNVSGFVTYTDSETWAGNIHPAQALRQYRSEFVGNAKAVVVGMTPTASPSCQFAGNTSQGVAGENHPPLR